MRLKNNKLINGKKTTIAIVGSGAIGLLWYSHLHLIKNNATECFLYQSPERKKLKKTIRFTSLSHKKLVIPTHVVSSNDKQPIDIILICVKSYQLNQAITDIHPLISANTVVITTHNGLGALNKASSLYLQHNIVLNLLTTHGCLKVSDNEIVHTGAGVSHLGIESAPTEKCSNSTFQSNITQYLHSALPNVIWCDELLSKQWLKLAINCVINPLTALHDINNGEITNKTFDETINALIDEVVTIAAYKNINLIRDELKETVLVVAKKTAKNSSSMRCDIQNNRRTEIDYINGYIHKLGKELDILTPKNTELYQKILTL